MGNKMENTIVIIGAIIGALGVAAGAFGAHGLANTLTPERMDTYEIAVRYQMYHALALFAVAWAISHWPGQTGWLIAAAWLFVAGVVLFSGSLYLLIVSGWRWMGAVTPLGGIAFIAGWVCVVVAAWKG
jgi:uncharacterized membrane protein YgdD (TMEM256/DUF423 family)